MPREFIGTVYRSTRAMSLDGASILLLLARRVAAGDRVALADLYRVLSAPILADVQASGIAADAADAVVAATFVEVWTLARLHTGRAANIADWIARIVRRRCFERRHGLPATTGETAPASDDRAWWQAVEERFDTEARTMLAELLDAAAGDRRALTSADAAGWRHRPVIAVSPSLARTGADAAPGAPGADGTGADATGADAAPSRRDTVRVPLPRPAELRAARALHVAGPDTGG